LIIEGAYVLESQMKEKKEKNEECQAFIVSLVVVYLIKSNSVSKLIIVLLASIFNKLN
jgi:hypothetical protein